MRGLAQHRVEPGEEESGGQVEVGHGELTGVGSILDEPAHERVEGLLQGASEASARANRAMITEEITAEYRTVDTAGVRAAACLRGGACPREAAATAAVAVNFRLDENLPASSAAVLASAGHDADTVMAEGHTGAPDQEVVHADTAGGRALITVDVAMGDVRAYPPGSHAGIVVLHLADQCAVTVTKAISDLAALAEPGSLAGVVAVLATRPAANPPSLTGA